MAKILREKKTPTWETAKFVLRMAIFYAPLLLGLIADIEAEGLLAALGVALMSLDKYKFVASEDNRGLVSF